MNNCPLCTVRASRTPKWINSARKCEYLSTEVMLVDYGRSHWVGDKVYDCNSGSTYFLINRKLWRIAVVVPQTRKKRLVLYCDGVNCEFILWVHTYMHPLVRTFR